MVWPGRAPGEAPVTEDIVTIEAGPEGAGFWRALPTSGDSAKSGAVLVTGTAATDGAITVMAGAVNAAAVSRPLLRGQSFSIVVPFAPAASVDFVGLRLTPWTRAEISSVSMLGTRAVLFGAPDFAADAARRADEPGLPELTDGDRLAWPSDLQMAAADIVVGGKLRTGLAVVDHAETETALMLSNLPKPTWRQRLLGRGAEFAMWNQVFFATPAQPQFAAVSQSDMKYIEFGQQFGVIGLAILVALCFWPIARAVRLAWCSDTPSAVAESAGLALILLVSAVSTAHMPSLFRIGFNTIVFAAMAIVCRREPVPGRRPAGEPRP
jgi:hypothetical protein